MGYKMIIDEMREHLESCLIPFWKSLRDNENGGYYGEVDYNLKINKRAVKGCILNSRILWFFANAYTVLKDESLLDEAGHAFHFLKDSFYDNENGGVFWSVSYNGDPDDTSKHTYNLAFAVYALSSYYEVSNDLEAYELAFDLFDLIEKNCTDQFGYKEAFDIYFNEVNNDKLSENGVIAQKTMNTLLHIMEAYTELYRVAPMLKVRRRLEWILTTFAEKVYNHEKRRLDVFFDSKMKPIIDIHSYGHDIEAAWLIERAALVLECHSFLVKMSPIISTLTEEVYRVAFDGTSVSYEAENSHINERRVWWVQAEALTGFMHGYKREPHRGEYQEAVQKLWSFITNYLIDKRPFAEWYSEVDKNGKNIPGNSIVDMWKCPYHNGRMCLEVLFHFE